MHIITINTSSSRRHEKSQHSSSARVSDVTFFKSIMVAMRVSLQHADAAQFHTIGLLIEYITAFIISSVSREHSWLSAPSFTSTSHKYRRARSSPCTAITSRSPTCAGAARRFRQLRCLVDFMLAGFIATAQYQPRDASILILVMQGRLLPSTCKVMSLSLLSSPFRV